jgi:transposase
MKRRKFDPAFKEMAVELSYAKGSVQEAARELGIDSSRITNRMADAMAPAKSPIRGIEQIDPWVD